MTRERVALVTGGGSGIGLAVAQALAGDGFRLALAGRDEAKLARACDGLANAIAQPCDVRRRESLDALVDAAVRRWGGIDVVVANAGGFSTRAAVSEVSAEDWEDVVATNLTGVFNTIAATIDQVRARRGHVFTIASVYSKHGLRLGTPYAASKWGVLGLSHSVLQEVAQDGVKVTAICPGIVATDMVGSSVPKDGLLQPEDVARTVQWCLGLSEGAIVREVVLERLAVARFDAELQEDDRPGSGGGGSRWPE